MKFFTVRLKLANGIHKYFQYFLLLFCLFLFVTGYETRQISHSREVNISQGDNFDNQIGPGFSACLGTLIGIRYPSVCKVIRSV